MASNTAVAGGTLRRDDDRDASSFGRVTVVEQRERLLEEVQVVVVDVERRDDGPTGVEDPRTERVAVVGIGKVSRPHLGDRGRERVGDSGRAVGRAVLDDADLEVVDPAAQPLDDVAHARLEQVALVVRGHDDRQRRHARRAPGRRRISRDTSVGYRRLDDGVGATGRALARRARTGSCRWRRTRWHCTRRTSPTRLR
jgi:hypothetical protein